MFSKVITLVILVSLTAAANAADSLKPYNIDKQAVTVSGVSSGAFMAVQLEVAYSATFSGAGSVAGGTYWCAQGNAQRAQTVCMNQPEAVKSNDHVLKAREWAAQGLIDPVENLRSHKVYIYASAKDAIIKPGHSDKLVEFYGQFTDAGKIHFEKSVQSAHGFPTLDKGNLCTLGFLPWLLKCNYDGAGEILKTLHGTLPRARGAFVAGHLQKFSQVEFDKGGYFMPEGWVYVPESCERGEKCALHIALHGCQMNPDYIQDQFARLAGYNEWAETNNIIVLYPQSAKHGRENPYACWDWFGFTGADYSLKSGVQMSAIKNMVERMSGGTETLFGN